ncbi:beta-galactosidase-1-like protein 3 isoform X4 [Felis catus]|uniref:beta-galactosidase-1-like protein 3 isoform X4 n=1 Tax=Felis catus TaxID=9685 RepID=UPI000C2FA45A|nr:beta-galactosidase-1-like protein 3 isoform X4 [Felis catus]
MRREQRWTRLSEWRVMGSLQRFSLCFSWKRILCIFFLPVILSGFAPRVKDKEDLIFANAQLQPAQYSMFNWSHLTPLKLTDRSVGLQTESRVGSKPYFTLGGHKFLIFGGSIHYFRVPREYWRDRLLKLKACGFNTLTTYVPWNLHEPQRGKFDFSGNLDLEAFVLMAAEIGLWVILRPGPYICSEMDLGGLPSWLLQDPKMILRTTYKGFVEAVNKYFDHLISRVVPLQYRKRGPIIAVQVENEYGSFAEDKDYMPYIQKALLERGIVELLMTSDDAKHMLKGYIEGVLATINMNTFQINDFKQLSQVQRNKPIMVMEFWVGWFDTWGGKHMIKNAEDVEDTVSKFITSEISFNVYMFHGGTNFGFMNGATYFGKHRGVVTSYDYDAVLTEAGDYTEKYFKLRKLFGSVVAVHLPPLPKLSPKAEYPAVKPSLYLPLWDVLQYLNKVFLNEKNIGFLGDGIKKLNIPKIRECQLLRILVENQGRVNFSWKIQDQRKGLTGSVTIDNIPLNGFIIYSLEMTMSFFERLRSATWKPVLKNYSGPAFYLGTLKAGSSPKDTFLRLLNWNYGFVFINGRNLGRYSIIGPQETLYLPGTWLHPRDNEIILFEKRKSGSYIQTIDEPKL